MELSADELAAEVEVQRAFYTHFGLDVVLAAVDIDADGLPCATWTVADGGA